MRYIILQLTTLLCSLFVNAQEFKGDTLIYENYRLLPGDTIHLGFGSGVNKNFLFVVFHQSSILAGSYPDARFSNSFIIYRGQKVKKVFGKQYNDPVFGINDTKIRVILQMKNAVQSNEIKGFGQVIKSNTFGNTIQK